MFTFPFISRRRSQPASERRAPAPDRRRPDPMPRMRWY